MNAQRHGVGRYQASGYYYAGQWKQGLRHGVGLELEYDDDNNKIVQKIAVYRLCVFASLYLFRD